MTDDDLNFVLDHVNGLIHRAVSDLASQVNDALEAVRTTTLHEAMTVRKMQVLEHDSAGRVTQVTELR